MRSSLSALRESTLKKSRRWGFSPYDDHRTPAAPLANVDLHKPLHKVNHTQETFDTTRLQIKEVQAYGQCAPNKSIHSIEGGDKLEQCPKRDLSRRDSV